MHNLLEQVLILECNDYRTLRTGVDLESQFEGGEWDKSRECNKLELLLTKIKFN